MPTSTSSSRTYSALRFLLLLGSGSVVHCQNNNTEPIHHEGLKRTTPRDQCFTTRKELEHAIMDYAVDYLSSSHSVISMRPTPAAWCVSNIPEDITDLRFEAETNYHLDLMNAWSRKCECEPEEEVVSESPPAEDATVLDQKGQNNNNNTDAVIIQDEEEPSEVETVATASSSSARSASDTATTTPVAGDPSKHGGSSSPVGGGDDKNNMPMMYRLMPIKLLAVLLVLSLGMAIRHMVDFRHYEGIDPSDQKTVEFELLQLAEEA